MIGDNEIRDRAKALDKHEWAIILKEAPIDLLFFTLKTKITMALDIIRLHDEVSNKVNRMYSDEDYVRWINEMPEL